MTLTMPRSAARFVAVLMLLIATAPLKAQATLVGSVHDSAGQPIAGAQISVDALGRRTTADDSGHYLLSGLSPGLRLVQVRRVGYTPVGKMVRLVDGENRLNDLLLDRVVVELDTVATRAQLRSHDVEMVEFEAHRKIGLGHFKTRADLEKLSGHSLVEAFAQMPGIRVVFDPRHNGEWSIETAHGPTSTDKPCSVMIYLDRVLLSRNGDPHLSLFTPDQLESIEVFANAAQTPVEYAGLGSPCGVVILHTRRP